MTEKLLNPGFESGLTNWAYSGTVNIDTDVFHSGSKSVRLEGNSYIQQNITPQAGKAYRVSCWIKTQSNFASPYQVGDAD